MHACAVTPSPLMTPYLDSGAFAAPELGTLRFRDVEEQASALTGWNQDYLQLSAGAFQGEISQIRGAGIKLFVESPSDTLRRNTHE